MAWWDYRPICEPTASAEAAVVKRSESPLIAAAGAVSTRRVPGPGRIQGFERVGTRAGAGVRASGGCPDTVRWWSTRQIADPIASADAERKNPGCRVRLAHRPGESHKSRIPQDPVYREPSCDEIAVESKILAHIHVMQTLDHDLTPRNATTMGRDD